MIPPILWCVVDKRGTVLVQPSEVVAALKARTWDIEWPSLSPHRVVAYSPTNKDLLRDAGATNDHP